MKVLRYMHTLDKGGRDFEASVELTADDVPIFTSVLANNLQYDGGFPAYEFGAPVVHENTWAAIGGPVIKGPGVYFIRWFLEGAE